MRSASQTTSTQPVVNEPAPPRYFTLRNLVFALLISYSITLFQFWLGNSRHERLLTKGRAVSAQSSFDPSSPGYLDLSFVTNNGDTIRHRDKQSRAEFDAHSRHLVVIYNPAEPREFDTAYDFASYNIIWRRVFFLFLYPVFLALFLLLLYRNLRYLFGFLRAAFRR